MKNTTFRIAAVMLAAAGAVLATAAVGRDDTPPAQAKGREFRVKDQAIEVSPEAAKRLKLETLVLTPSTQVVTLHLTGKTSFDGDRVAHVKAQFPGKIMTAGPALGTRVSGPAAGPGGKATLLCTIESVDLGNAKNAFQKAKVQLDLDRDSARRVKDLVDEKVLADRFLKEAEATLRMDEANYEFARRSLVVFGVEEASLEKIPVQERWERMTYDIASPISGVLVEKNVTPGEYADSTVNLFTIADTRRLWVWGDVYEMDWGKVEVGQKLYVSIAALPGRTYTTTVDLIAPSLDPVSRGIRVRGTLDNPEGTILKDMYSNLTVEVGRDPAALAAPAEALVRGLQADEAYLFVRVPGSQGGGGDLFERRQVRFESLEGGRVRLLEGVHAGEAVVTVGAAALDDEMRRK
ncbi:MAG TPA: efflux RND transporter periplasmic adaptor subunit [Planctomycetota bacterium]|nr:efflux RND transporter periplasmic adaptor subunit [Planctomycetota bacterium]